MMARLAVFTRMVAALAGAALVGSACGGARRPSTVVSPGRECALFPTPVAAAESASIVVTSPVDLTNAPRPATWGERFVFALAYDTGLHVDCRGRPLASGRYRARDVGGSTLALEPIDGASGPRLTIYSADESRARDLIDAGIDLLLTDSPALAAYAATRSDVVAIPLGWDRTWVLATGRGSVPGLDTSAAFRAGLARDVVRTDARPAEGPYWWSDTTGCNTPSAVSSLAPVRTSRVAYPRDETVARALAERLVAIVGGRATAVGLAPNAFASALRSGAELVYVLPLPRLSRDRCRDVNDLISSAPWMEASGDITPLIDTRLRAVAKRDRLNLAFTWDSTLTVLPVRP